MDELRFVNIKTLVRTAKKSSENVILKDLLKSYNWRTHYFTKEGRIWYKNTLAYFPHSIFSSNTGIIVNFLLERRLNKILNDILSTCHFYKYNSDNERKKAIENAITMITKYLDIRSHQHLENKKYENIKARISILSAVTGIFISPLGIAEIVKLVPVIPTLSFPFVENQILSIISMLLPSLIILALEIPLLWIVPQLSWYRKIIKVSGIRRIESCVYDSN